MTPQTPLLKSLGQSAAATVAHNTAFVMYDMYKSGETAAHTTFSPLGKPQGFSGEMLTNQQTTNMIPTEQEFYTSNITLLP